jgi:putative NADH-flavin reductase
MQAHLKLVVLGAKGATGLQVVREAIKRGLRGRCHFVFDAV